MMRRRLNAYKSLLGSTLPICSDSLFLNFSFQFCTDCGWCLLLLLSLVGGLSLYGPFLFKTFVLCHYLLTSSRQVGT